MGRFIDNTFESDKPSTQGVVVRRWNVTTPKDETIRLNVWDFGGQELQHSTHEFFLAERAVYLLVYNPREDQGARQNLYYWLDLIRLVGPHAPILVALSRQDQYSGHVDGAESMMRDFGVREFVRVSCNASHSTFSGIGRLKELIAEEAGRLEHVSNRLPASWMQVKSQLEQPGIDYLPYAEFVRLCCQEGIDDKEDQKVLVRFLHDLGTMLNYADRMPLEKTNILNPSWVTEGVYALVLADDLKADQGILKESLVARLDELVEAMLRKEGRLAADQPYRERYPDTTQRFILEMMRQFELFHPLPADGAGCPRYLVPNALPDHQPPGVAIEKGLCFQLRYPRLLPTSVISRFMVHMQAHPHESKLWRQGMKGTLEGHPFLVTLDDRDKRIRVAVAGPLETRVLVLDKIRQCLTLANRGKRGLEPEAWVPLPNDPEAGIKYDFLLQLANDGVRSYPVEGSDKKLRKVDPEELLGRIGERQGVRQILNAMEESAFDLACRRRFPDVEQRFTSSMMFRAKAELLCELLKTEDARDILKHLLGGETGLRAGTRHAEILGEEEIDEAAAPTRPPKPSVPQIGAAGDWVKRDNHIRLLHLSDLHFTGKVKPATKLEWLASDLHHDLKTDRLDFVVLSGDFTDKGQSDGLKLAAEFVTGLCDRFGVPRERCLVVPGNHDVQEWDDAYDYARACGH